MISLAEGKSEILLLAPGLLGEALAGQLNQEEPQLNIFLEKENLTKHPSLVIWYLDSIEAPTAIQIELRKLSDYWRPAPILLMIPEKISLKKEELLQFGCSGILQAPDFETLKKSISTILGGGRVYRLKNKSENSLKSSHETLGLGQWLLISGLQQINLELIHLENILNNKSLNLIHEEILKGKRRELHTSKKILHLLWGSTSGSIDINRSKINRSISTNTNETNIDLKNKTSEEVWSVISGRILAQINSNVQTTNGLLLGLDSINLIRRKELFLSLHTQLDKVIKKLQTEDSSTTDSISTNWSSLQSKIKEEVIRQTSGTYVRLPKRGILSPISDSLINSSDLINEDEELPDPIIMLSPLTLNNLVSLEGQLLPPDDPRALLYLETLFTNWLIRTSELLSQEILSASAEWPEIRQYFLISNLISTRQLEKLRNQINYKNKWENIIERPIQLYESKRLLYKFKEGKITSIFITEPRDEELKTLTWIQQQVALLVEARDAIAPQLQTLIRKFGDLMVVLLTKVLGRSIGLIGRGIAQGMGRTLGRS